MSTRLEKLMFKIGVLDKASAPVSKIQGKINELTEKSSQAFAKIAAGTAGLAGSAYAAMNALQPAREIGAKIGELASLDVPIAELDKLTNAAFKASAKYGTAASEFIESSYDIQSAISGLKPGQLGKITDSMSTLAVATKAKVGNMTSLMGSLYGIFEDKALAMGVGKFSQKVAAVTAKSVQMFKTTGKAMEDAFRGVGSLAKTHGIAMEEQFAVMGSLQATMPGAEAGTKYKAFLAGVIKAQKSLNLSFTDSHGKMLPMTQVLEKIKLKYGELDSIEVASLSKAFGSQEAVQVITGLIDKTDKLKTNVEAVGNADFSLVEKMALKIADPWDKAGASITSLTAKLGGLFLPAVNAVMDRIAIGMVSVMDWVDANPALAKTLSKVAVAAFAIISGLSILAVLSGLVGLGMAGIGVVLGSLLSPFAVVAAGVGTLAFMWDKLSASQGISDGMIAGVKYLASVAWNQISAFLDNIGAGFNSILTPLLALMPASNNLLSTLFGLGNALDGPTSNAAHYGKIFGKVLAYAVVGLFAFKAIMIAVTIATKAWGAAVFVAKAALVAGRLAKIAYIATAKTFRAITLALIIQQKLLASSLAASRVAMVSSKLAMAGMTAGSIALKGALAFALSPIGLIIAGIAAVAAVSYYLYNKWDELTSGLEDTAWGRVLKSVLDKVTLPFRLFGFAIDVLINGWDRATANFKEMSWSKPILAVIEKISAGFDKLVKGWNKVKSFTKGKLDTISNAAGGVVDKATTTITRYLPAWLGGGSEKPETAGNRAMGGLVRAGNVYRINERVPEILIQGGQSFLLNDTAGRVAPLSSTTNNNVSSSVDVDDIKTRLQQLSISNNVASTVPQGGISRQITQHSTTTNRDRLKQGGKRIQIGQVTIHTQELDADRLIQELEQAS